MKLFSFFTAFLGFISINLLSAQMPADWEKRFPTSKELTQIQPNADGFCKLFSGFFSNEKQAQKDTSKSVFKSAVYIVSQPIWQDKTPNVRWVLLSRFFKGQAAPYMQWIYRVEDLPQNELSVQIMFIPADIAGEYLNEWKKEKPFDAYSPADLEKANPEPCILDTKKVAGEEALHMRLQGDICRFPIKIGEAAGLYIDVLVKNTEISLRGDVLNEHKKVVAAMGDQILLRLSHKEIKKRVAVKK